MERKEGLVAGAAISLVVYVLALSFLSPAMSATSSSRTLASSGTIKGIGVGIYSDLACTTAVSSFAWGTLDPGTSANRTVYIRNEGNAAATLSMATSNWNPAGASSYITLNWNYAGQTLAVNQVLQVRFTLTVSSGATGITNFGFDITVTATG